MITNQFYVAIDLLFGGNGSFFQPMLKCFYEPVCKFNKIVFAPIVFYQFVLCRFPFSYKFLQILRTCSPEFKNILVIVANRDDPHFLVFVDKGINQGIFVGIHILRLINYQNRFCNPVYLHVSVFNFFGRALQNCIRFLQVPDLSQQIEAIGMESLYFNVVGCISNKRK